MKTVLIAAAAASLALAAPAFADPGGHGEGKHNKGHKDKGGQHYDRDDNKGAWTPPGLAKKPGGMPPGQYKKKYRQGQRLPTTYVSRQQYYVENPQTYRLREPPAGYRWVQVGDQYYLAQTRTGLISEVVSALIR